MYQFERIVYKREQQLLICCLVDAVFRIRNLFLRVSRIIRYRFRNTCGTMIPAAGWKTIPGPAYEKILSDNRCMDFHLLAMSCATEKKTGK